MTTRSTIEVLVGFSPDVLERLDNELAKRTTEWAKQGHKKFREPTAEEERTARQMAKDDGGNVKRANEYLAKATKLTRELTKPSRRGLVVEAVLAWLEAQKK